MNEVTYECETCGFPVPVNQSVCPNCNAAFTDGVGAGIGQIGALPGIGWTEVFLIFGVGLFGGYLLSGVLAQAPGIISSKTVKR